MEARARALVLALALAVVCARAKGGALDCFLVKPGPADPVYGSTTPTETRSRVEASGVDAAEAAFSWGRPLQSVCLLCNDVFCGSLEYKFAGDAAYAAPSAGPWDNIYTRWCADLDTAAGERVTEVWVASGSRLDGLRLTTSAGRVFTLQPASNPPATLAWAPVPAPQLDPQGGLVPVLAGFQVYTIFGFDTVFTCAVQFVWAAAKMGPAPAGGYQCGCPQDFVSDGVFCDATCPRVPHCQACGSGPAANKCLACVSPTYTQKGGKCVCSKGYGPSADKKSCVACKSDHYSRGGALGSAAATCKPCPPGTVPGPDRSQCV